MQFTERQHRTTALAGVGFGIFLVITVLVQLRLLAGFDEAAALAKRALASGVLDTWSTACGIAVSGELSVVYGVIGAYFLWRAGLGRWSVAPLAFVVLVPVELAMKIFVDQPAVPSDFWRDAYYPLAALALQGTFPSGHAIRTGFLCAFLAILLAARGGIIGRIAPPGLGILAVLIGLSRVYLGDHWLSDVIAGLILGTSLALIVAPPVAERIIRPATDRGGKRDKENVTRDA